jgi:3',5'-cyclic AMP phosphodiesterase CpdA
LLDGAKAGYAPAPFYIVQLSDTHIVDFDAEIFEIKTADRLKQAVEEINDLNPQPDFVIVTGDFAMNTLRGYETFKVIMDQLEMPWLVAFGNHDKPSGLAAAARIFSEWGLPEFYAFDYKGYRFYVLDTVAESDPKQGEIYPRQLDWLRALLSDSPTLRPGLYFTHHELFSGYGVKNQDEVQSVLESVPGRQWLFSGHWHMDCFVQRGNQQHVITTTTAYVWPQDRWDHVRYEPGYRLIHFSHGQIWTEFKPLGGDIEPDPPGGVWYTPEEFIADLPVPEEDAVSYE